MRTALHIRPLELELALASMVAGALACGPRGLGADGPVEGSSTHEDGSTGEVVESGSEGSGESGSETTTTTADDETFLPEVDLPPESCDMFMQDCPEGQKCVPYSSSGGNWDNHKYVPVLGDQAPGEPGSTCDVVPGTSCVPFFEGGMVLPGYENVGICIRP